MGTPEGYTIFAYIVAALHSLCVLIDIVWQYMQNEVADQFVVSFEFYMKEYLRSWVVLNWSSSLLCLFGHSIRVLLYSCKLHCHWDQQEYLCSQNGNLSVVFNKTNDNTFLIVGTRKMNECQRARNTTRTPTRTPTRKRRKKKNSFKFSLSSHSPNEGNNTMNSSSSSSSGRRHRSRNTMELNWDDGAVDGDHAMTLVGKLSRWRNGL